LPAFSSPIKWVTEPSDGIGVMMKFEIRYPKLKNQIPKSKIHNPKFELLAPNFGFRITDFGFLLWEGQGAL
jgi:hypothetical protein